MLNPMVSCAAHYPPNLLPYQHIPLLCRLADSLITVVRPLTEFVSRTQVTRNTCIFQFQELFGSKPLDAVGERLVEALTVSG